MSLLLRFVFFVERWNLDHRSKLFLQVEGFQLRKVGSNIFKSNANKPAFFLILQRVRKFHSQSICTTVGQFESGEQYMLVYFLSFGIFDSFYGIFQHETVVLFQLKLLITKFTQTIGCNDTLKQIESWFPVSYT